MRKRVLYELTAFGVPSGSGNSGMNKKIFPGRNLKRSYKGNHIPEKRTKEVIFLNRKREGEGEESSLTNLGVFSIKLK